MENMPVKVGLSWKHEVSGTVICHIKLLPDKFSKLTKFRSRCGQIPTIPPGLNRANKETT